MTTLGDLRTAALAALQQQAPTGAAPEPAPRAPDGRWLPGRSANPAGRPPGPRRAAARLVMGLIAESAGPVAQKMVELARQGDRAAMRFCIDRVLGPARAQPFDVELGAPSTDVALAGEFGRIIEAVGVGELTPAEAKTLCGVLHLRRKSTHYLKPEQIAEADAVAEDGERP